MPDEFVTRRQVLNDQAVRGCNKGQERIGVVGIEYAADRNGARFRVSHLYMRLSVAVEFFDDLAQRTIPENDLAVQPGLSLRQVYGLRDPGRTLDEPDALARAQHLANGEI